ncbi:MAG: MAPEG family protein [Lysobacteraceae bacterium]
MNTVHIVALLAVVQFILFGILVGRARGKYGIKAPATSGHEMFDRAYRVHANTLELLVCFLPALLIASAYWPNHIIAGIGAVYLVGRFIYWRAYMTNPASRAIGFALSMIPVLALVIFALVGAVIR